MSQITVGPARPLYIDKEPIQRIVAEQNAPAGYVLDPAATAEKAPAITRALGIPPAANSLSTGIIAARDE